MPRPEDILTNLRRWLSGGLALGFAWLMVGVSTLAQAEEPIVTAEATPVDTPAAWSELIRATVVASIPAETVKDKHWNRQTEVVTRYDLKTKGGRVSLRPKTRQVNHGLWQRHTITLLQPEKTLELEFREVTQAPDGTLHFTMQVKLRARVDTDFAHWVYGVKGINGSVRADATIAAQIRCAVKLETVLPPGAIFPSLQATPMIETLRLSVRDIDAKQIGFIGGWAAEEIGDNSRSAVNSLVNDRTDKILNDLQKKIEKNKDKYRINPTWLNPKPVPKER